MFAGLHAGNHHMAVDGSGRDVGVLWDGGWRNGRLNGAGSVPLYHPIFQRLEKEPMIRFEEPWPPRRLRQALDGSGRFDEAAGAAAPDSPTMWRLPGGGLVMRLPKKIDESRRLHKSRSDGSTTLAATHSGSSPAWRTRETCASFDCWSKRLPKTASSKSLTRRAASPLGGLA